jgi:outer membrane receptor protein involved in Fe transport
MGLPRGRSWAGAVGPSHLHSRGGRDIRKTSHRSAPAVLLVLAVARARAAEPEEPLGEVVVTAPPAREEGSARDPTAFATVVDTSSAPARVETLTEALSDTVGVQVRRFGGLGDFSTVSIRGSSAGQVQVYLDGVPLARAQNEVVNLADLPLDAVERVEVYRGTTPLAFAQSGAGGIVNVVTRRPGDVPLTAASTSYGSFDTRKVDVTRSARVGPWEYLGFAHYLGSAGDFTFLNDLGTTANPADDRIETRQNNAFNLGDLTARLGWRPDDTRAVSLTSDSFARQEGVPGVGSVQALDTRLTTVRQIGHLDLDLTPRAGAILDTQASGWVLYQHEHFVDRHGEVALVPTDTNENTYATGVQGLVRAALGAHQVPGVLVAVSDERFDEHDQLSPFPEPGARTQLRATLAAEDEILGFGERLSVLPGLRWEIFRDDFGGEPGVPPSLAVSGVQVEDFLSPRLGVRFAPVPTLTLLGNIGRWPRVPNLSELFGTQGVVVGNPHLKPEVALNADIGFRYRPPSVGPFTQLALEYAFFDNQVDDLIVLVQNSQRVVRPENVTSASVRGSEVTVRGRVLDRVGLSANYTHQDAHDDGDVTFLRGKQLPGRPADEAFGRVELGWSPTHPLPRLPGLWPGRVFYEVNAIAGNFLDRANVRSVGSRFLQDVGIELALPLPGVRLTLEGKNLGDDQTRDALGFPLPGRAFFATVSYGIGGRGGEDAR